VNVKKIINGIAVVVSLIIVSSLFSVWYLSDSKELPDSRALVPEVRIADIENASTPELMDALNISQVEDPWEAPDFDLDPLEGEAGGLSQYRGSYVLLTFWTTW
jgi:hypothetical protein